MGDISSDVAEQTRLAFMQRFGNRPSLVLGTHFATPTAGHVRATARAGASIPELFDQARRSHEEGTDRRRYRTHRTPCDTGAARARLRHHHFPSEPPGLPEVEHIHGDPHFPGDHRGGARWPQVRTGGDHVRPHPASGGLLCPTLRARFIGVGGIPVYAGLMDPEGQRPWGLPVPVRKLSRYPPIQATPTAVASPT